MQLILLGTGTSFGIPVIGCKCKACTSKNIKDIRNRTSAYITDSPDEKNVPDFKPTGIVIDTGQEFRLQAIQNNITRLDAVLLTHAHADHIFGLDDLRVFSRIKPEQNNMPEQNKKTEPLPIYANTNALNYIKNAFAYAFTEVTQGGGVPNLILKDNSEYSADRPLKINELEILPLELFHGTLKDSGYLISHTVNGIKKSAAYLTDCSRIPDETFELILRNCGQLEHVVIDSLRLRTHSTHFNFDESLEAAERLKPVHTWFTHICHDFLHTEIQAYIDSQLEKYKGLSEIVKNGGSVSPGYDGLILEF